MKSIHAASNYFYSISAFFDQVLQHMDDERLLKAIKEDVGDIDLDDLFVSPDELYSKLNRGGSKTRDFLILKNQGLL